MPLESYKELKVWQRSIELVKEVYKTTEKFPKSEIYGLVSQSRRAAVSIPSNIAEGYKRKNLGEYVQFLSIADASAAELETQLIISKDLYSDIDFSKAISLIEEIQKMLFVLIKKLNPKPSTLNPNRGQVLVESIIAISVAIVGLLGAFTILQQSLRINRSISDRYVAANLASEGVELIKNMISHNLILKNVAWNSGNCLADNPSDHEIDYNDNADSPCANQNRYLKFDPNSGYYNYETGNDSKFKRTIFIEWPSTDEIKVNSLITWKDSTGDEFTVNLEDHFFNWSTPPQCNDGIDNDNDTKIDFRVGGGDPNCLSKNDNNESS